MIKSTSKVSSFKILKINSLNSKKASDLVAIEEPLQIIIQFIKSEQWIEKPLSITMRTPGNDFQLALGFLFSEGIINSINDVLLVRYCETVKDEEKGNVVIVKLSPKISVDLKDLNRYFYTNSSCGICGKTAIESIISNFTSNNLTDEITIKKDFFLNLNDSLREHQIIFKHTGGIHASALFDLNGKLISIKEDVGRHNALDKVIGTALEKECIPLKNHILFLSGRISFELVQKAIRSGIHIIAAIGAPSSLAINLAIANKITLVGFIKKDSYNIYSCPERIII